MTPGLWAGIVGLVRMRIEDVSFGGSFPTRCSKDGITGTNEANFDNAAAGEALPWPDRGMPNLFQAMDLVEFCWEKIAKPVDSEWCFYNHQHYEFNQAEGRSDFREAVNRIFSRHGMRLELTERGEVVRLPYPALREEIVAANFNTGDKDLDKLLELSRTLFLDPDVSQRPLAIEKAWDAFERLKTLEEGDKKASIGRLLEKASVDEAFRNVLDEEAASLTKIGNHFHIRHFERNRTSITEPVHFDYLFHRLFALIALFLRRSGRM